jgi:hypothetical protein
MEVFAVSLVSPLANSGLKRANIALLRPTKYSIAPTPPNEHQLPPDSRSVSQPDPWPSTLRMTRSCKRKTDAFVVVTHPVDRFHYKRRRLRGTIAHAKMRLAATTKP